MKSVATIIVTYNGAPWIHKCLQHLVASTIKTEIIVVDNASTDNTIDLVNKFGDDISLFQMDENLGFGAANNMGIKKALAMEVDFVFLLNQDAYVSKNCIKNLITAAAKNNDFGILSPLQFNGSGDSLDVTFKNQFSRNLKVLPKSKFQDISEESGPRAINEVRFVGAAAWFLPASVIRRVGQFHPVFYHYGEDNNYAARVQYWSYKIGVVIESSVIHDRVQRKDLQKFLPVKMRSFPLHLLLDIRKPLPISWLTGLYQLLRIRSKLRKVYGDKYEVEFEKSKSWFFGRVREVKQIRAYFKKPFEA